MRPRGQVIALAAATLALITLVPSGSSAPYCFSTLTVEVGTGDHAAYIIHDYLDGYHPLWTALHVYAESNGRAGLQRGGASTLLPEPDYCQQSDDPDTFLY